MKSSFHRPLLFVWMETSPPPPSTTSAPLVQNTISVVGTWRLSSSNNGLVWIWWVWILRQCNPDCVTVWFEPTDSYKARKPFLSDAWKSLSYTSPNLAELCTIHKTLGFPTPEGKRKCLFSPRSDRRTVVISVPKKQLKWSFFFTCASAAKHPWWGPGNCCGSLTPPSGAHSLSDSDPGCTWDSSVWRARWRLHQPATKKTEEGKDELIFTARSHWCMWSGGPICVSEEETLCFALPGTDHPARGDSKCVGSRR